MTKLLENYVPALKQGASIGKLQNLTTTGNTVLGNAGTDTVTISGTATITGLLTATAGTTGKVLHTGSETIAGGGTTTALDLTKFHHDINADAGGDIFTLANGTAGQMTLIVLKTATGVATITPATFLGGTSITLNAVGDSVFLYYGALGWQIVGGNSYAIS